MSELHRGAWASEASARGWPCQRRAAARRRSLWIDAPGQEAELDLIERLRPLRAEVARSRDGHCRIGIEAAGREWDAVVIRTRALLLDWARGHGIAATRLGLDGRAVVVAL